MMLCLKRFIITRCSKYLIWTRNIQIISYPTSYFPFIVVARHIEKHLEQNDLHDKYQFAYLKGHSIETALLKMYSDTAEAAIEGSIAALTNLDITAAFDVML